MWKCDYLGANRQAVCRELDLSNVELIVPTLKAMALVTNAAPKLEKFKAQVTALVQRSRRISPGGAPYPHEVTADPSSGAEVVTCIESWLDALGETERLRAVRSRVVEALVQVSQRATSLSRHVTSLSSVVVRGARAVVPRHCHDM